MNNRMFTICSILGLLCVFFGSYAQSTDDNSTIIISSTVSSLTSTEKNTVNTSCEVHSNDCKACVANTSCYYCDETGQCRYDVLNTVAEGQCSMKHVRYLTCRVTLRTLAIIIGSLIGVVFLIITIVCCYCCCKRKGIKISKDDLKWARQREERKQIAADRRKERAERTEEIRKKYGLVKDSNPYQRFDA